MADETELWQPYGEDGEPLVGQTLTKTEAAKGVLHGASHVWVWRKRGGEIQILLQLRGPDKSTWPDYLDISAAGHIDAGETPLAAAVRETAEEIGLKLPSDHFKLLYATRHNAVAPPHGFIENEVQFLYGVELRKARIHLDQDEVAGVYWVNFAEFEALCDGGRHDGHLIIPHGPEYFSKLQTAFRTLT